MKLRIESADLNRLAVYGLLIIAVLLLQTVSAVPLGFGITKPGLAIAVSVCVGIFAGTKTGAVFGAVLGFIIDCTSGQYVGLSALIMMYSGMFAGMFTYKLMWRNLGAGYLIFTGVYIVIAGANAIWYFLVTYRPEILMSRFIDLGFEFAVTAVYFLPIFYIIKLICTKISNLG